MAKFAIQNPIQNQFEDALINFVCLPIFSINVFCSILFILERLNTVKFEAMDRDEDEFLATALIIINIILANFIFMLFRTHSTENI